MTSIPLPQDEQTPQRGKLGLGAILILVVTATIAVIFAVALIRQQATQPTEGAAPDFAFETFDGQSYRLSDFRGKVVVLNFWASWCGPCREEAPVLQSLWEYYQPRGDVVFLGIAYADNGPRSLAYLEEFGVTYLNAPDRGTRVSEMYHIQGVPETFIIDKDGQIDRFIFSVVREAQLRAIIDELVARG